MNQTVLVVEDDPATLEVLGGILALDEFTVVSTSSPEHVCRLAATIAPDLLLVDLMLPGMSGIELAAELREDGFNIPMIGMSGSPLMREIAEETGLFQALLEKPLDFDMLTERIWETVEVPL